MSDKIFYKQKINTPADTFCCLKSIPVLYITLTYSNVLFGRISVFLSRLLSERKSVKNFP